MKPKYLTVGWLFTTIFYLIMISACSGLKHIISNNHIRNTLKKSPVFSSQFTGFCLYDPSVKTTIFESNSTLYFTPASNTKILTALASLESLGDSLSTFSYFEKGDSIYLVPHSDPTFLHPSFINQPALKKLRHYPRVFVHYPGEPLDEYGPGWAWEDYHYDFQPERSWFPIYGNVIWIENTDSILITPPFFRDYVEFVSESGGIARNRHYNLFQLNHPEQGEYLKREIPFDYNTEILEILLEDTLGNEVRIGYYPGPYPDTLYSQNTLFTVAMMMLPSDNFLAEHLLIQSAIRSGFKNVDAFRAATLRRWNQFLPDPVQWYDGSGLSRYNLITPRSLVAILNELYTLQEWAEIKSIFPTGGVTGTIKNWYSGDQPYVFAKTGTLKNNHCLSGFIQTRSGKILIFSLMNNHHIGPLTAVKKEMNQLLEYIRDRY